MEVQPEIPCIRRLSKEDDGVDAWRVQKTFDGITFRVNVPDRDVGSEGKGFKLATSFLHLLNRLLSMPRLQISYKGKDVSASNSKRIYEVPDEYIDRETLNSLVYC